MGRGRRVYEKVLREVIDRALAKAWAPLPPIELERTARALVRLGAGQRQLLARNSQRAANPNLIGHLIERSYELRFSNPSEGARLAEVAVETAEAIETGLGWDALLFDLRAEAWGNLANARRVADDLTGAESAWQSCDGWLGRGSGDPNLRAVLLRQKAQLRHLQRRFEEAQSQLSESASLFDRLQDPHAAGKARLALACAYSADGRPKDALAVTPVAAKQIDGFREPEMGLALLHNSLFFLEADGQKLLALRLSERLEPEYHETGSAILAYRGWELRGRLYAGFEAWKLAAPLFDRARRGFLQLGLTYDAALAGFDLALAWMHSGGFGRVQKLAAEMYDVFTAREIPREAAAALLLFANAARCHQADLRLLLRVKAALDPLRPSQAAPAAPAPRE